MLVQDILDRIDRDFSPQERDEVKKMLTSIWEESGDRVGKDSICRSIVFLADGSLQRIKDDIMSVLKEDPREVLDWAEIKAGRPEHYFIITFPEIDTFFEKLYEEMDEDPPAEIWKYGSEA